MRRLVLLALVTGLAACTESAPPRSTSAEVPIADHPGSNPAKTPETAAPRPETVPTRPEAVGMAPANGLSGWKGYGDTRFGMNEADFKTAWGGELRNLKEDPSCFHLTPKNAKTPADLAFMFVDGKFARYSTESAKETAPGGGKVGSSAQELERLYPDQIEVQPHKYTDGRYLRVKHGASVLIFATDKAGIVREWRVGQPPAVDYVEGCA